MHRRKFIKTTGTAGILLWLVPSDLSIDSDTGVTLDQNFHQPPASVYPKLIWFWMNGNISREGITLDLEAMKHNGISGVFNFDAGEGVPKGPVSYLNTEWIELKKHAVSEATRLGMEFVQHNCPGWSASGGPWITPELAMQEITWTEVFITGGKKINMQLPLPQQKLNYYRDIAVLAFPSLQGEAPLDSLVRKISSGNGTIDVHKLNDADGVTIMPDSSSSAYLEFEFNEPYEARFINFFISSLKSIGETIPDKKTSIVLQSSDDGIHFQNVVTINTGFEPGLAQGYKFITYDIPFTRAKYFRLVSDEARRYKEIKFSGVERLDHFMEKAGFRFMFNGDDIPGIFSKNEQSVPASSIINYDSILNITDYVSENGALNWQAPSGDWTILRMGYTPTGSMIKAAPDTAIGLECDKFSKAAFDHHFHEMMKPLLPVLKQIKAKIGLEIDSYEAGMQNWTALFPEGFRKRRGYDLWKYLAAITGRVINSVEYTERFLWDFRRTQADLMGENYYGRFTELCHQHGFTSYIEPYERGPMEEMQAGARPDVVLGEFWNGIFSVLQNNFSIRRITKLVSSIAHVNGKKIAGAESFTSEAGSSQWQEYPFLLKASGDLAFIKGVNEMIISCYTHQPHLTVRPGLSLGSYGIHFERTNTWWNQSKPWINYLARCQYLLQQGRFVADLLYFSGEESHLYTRTNPNELDPAPPEGFDYDIINAETILKRVDIIDNQIHLPDGMRYRVMVFQQQLIITLPLLRKLHALVKAGMVLIGDKPSHLAGLDPANIAKEFERLANELWPDESERLFPRQLGKGFVYGSASLSASLTKLDLKPDFQYSSKSGNAAIQFIHRKDEHIDIYFIANKKRKREELVCTFRVRNKQPEHWNAVTGKILPLLFYEITDDSIRVPVQLDPYGSAFIVFRSSPSSQPYESLFDDNIEIVSTKDFIKKDVAFYNSIIDNFTISFWAKPEINSMLVPSIYMSNLKTPWTDAYAIYPPSGKNLYGKGHAACGLAVGRNGITVWEHEEIPMWVLTAEVSLQGWSHIALRYNQGVPSVYVNGKFVVKGKKSDYTLHPALGEDSLPGENAYFIGDMSTPVLYKEVLSEEQIAKLSISKPQINREEHSVEASLQNGKPAFLVRKNGTYALRNKTRSASFNITAIENDIVLKGPWQVRFPPLCGAPSQIVLNELISLHIHAIEGVKYFSGTAAYHCDFDLKTSSFPAGAHLFLDLGRVEVIAEVVVNQKSLGVLWTRPYRIDITNAVKKGMNRLTINVTNLWVNRLIGDAQTSGEQSENGIRQSLPEWYLSSKPKPDDGKITFTTWQPYNKNSPLVESGLIGPVVLQSAIVKSI